MEKGILTAQLESVLAEKLDEVVKAKGILESLDGPAFKILITVIDNNVAEKIPEPYKTNIQELLTDILEEKNYAEAADKAASMIDLLLDIPGLDDDTERLIFTGIFTAIAGLFAKINT